MEIEFRQLVARSGYRIEYPERYDPRLALLRLIKAKHRLKRKGTTCSVESMLKGDSERRILERAEPVLVLKYPVR